MRKLYIVRLTKQERVELQCVVKKLNGTGQKVRRAQILLKADADGPNWTDQRIAEAFSCRTRTVERLRQWFVEQGFDEALHRIEWQFGIGADHLFGPSLGLAAGFWPKCWAWSLRRAARRDL